MAIKNQAITVCYQAWNTSTNAGQTGDSANHTLKVVQDGTEGSPTNGPTQVDATNLPGLYSLALTAGDMNYNCVVLGGKSSTANVVIIPLLIITERGNINTGAAPSAAGGLLTVGTSTGQINPTSGGVDVQTIKTQAITCAVGVTVGPFVGNATHAITVDSSGDVTFNNTSIATVTTVTNQLTAAAIATGVWQDATSGDFTAANSIGKSLYTTGAAPGASGGIQINGTNLGSVSYTSGITTNITGNLSGSVGSVTGAVTVSLTQTLNVGRALDSIADTSLTLNDALQCAVAGITAQVDASSGTSCVFKTASTATLLRTKAVTLIAAPTTVPSKAV